MEAPCFVQPHRSIAHDRTYSTRLSKNDVRRVAWIGQRKTSRHQKVDEVLERWPLEVLRNLAGLTEFSPRYQRIIHWEQFTWNYSPGAFTRNNFLGTIYPKQFAGNIFSMDIIFSYGQWMQIISISYFQRLTPKWSIPALCDHCSNATHEDSTLQIWQFFLISAHVIDWECLFN